MNENIETIKHNILYTRDISIDYNLKVNFILKLIVGTFFIKFILIYNKILCIGYFGIYIIFSILKFLIYYESQDTFDEYYGNSLQNKSFDEILYLLNTKSEDIPFYSVLVPVYQENYNTMANLKKNLNAIVYPDEKIEIRILVEEHDFETIEICNVLELNNGRFTIIIVPDDNIKTKGRALNYGILGICGKYIVVYDAEDIPHPMQLLLVMHKFRLQPNLQVIQCNLRYYNRINWLTELFYAEYEYIFTIRNNITAKLFNFVMLGGTSNHFNTERIKQINGWDSFNVTEDFEVSLQFLKNNWDMGTLNIPTQEEAVISMKPWIKQRSRWIKGYMQTFITYLFDEKSLKVKPFTNLFFLIYCNVAILLPLFFIITSIDMSLSIFIDTDASTTFDPRDCIVITLIFVPILIDGIFYNMVHIDKDRNSHILKFFSILGARFVYSFMYISAYIKAIIELIYYPHYWDKTEHLGTFSVNDTKQ